MQQHAVTVALPPVASEAHQLASQAHQGVATHRSSLSCDFGFICCFAWQGHLLAFMLSVCYCVCTRHSHCVPSSLSVSMCAALHADSSSHADAPHTHADSLLVCTVDDVEKKRKKLYKQHEAAVGTPAVATNVGGRPCLSALVCCPNLNYSADEFLHPRSKCHSVEMCQG